MESPFDRRAARVAPPCPICSGSMECVYNRYGEKVFVCVECQSGLTVPRNAWEIGQVKKKQRQDKPDEKTG